MKYDKELNVEIESDGEFTHSSVPKSARKGIKELLFVWIGYVFTVTIMTAGGNIALGSYNIAEALKAVAIAFTFLVALGSVIGIMSAKTGLTFGLLARYTFGQKGSSLISLAIMTTLLGWFSINTYLVGSVTNILFPSVPILPVSIVAGFLMTLTALKGMEIMNKIGMVATALILTMGLTSLYLAVSDVGGLRALMNVTNENTIPFNQVVSIAIGSVVSGAVSWTPDVMRFAKNRSTAIIVMTVAIGISAPFMIIIGIVGMLVYNESDIAYILKAQGLIYPAWFALVANVWSTAQGNVYSSSLNLSSIFLNTPRKRLVIIFGGIGTLMGLLGIYEYFGAWLSFLASIFPAVGGVIIADSFITYKNGYYTLKSVKLPSYNWFSFISVLVGIAASYLLPFGLSAINSLIVGALVQAIFGVWFLRSRMEEANKDNVVVPPVI